jgi:hypothetical protein
MLVDTWDWRAVFIINLPVGILLVRMALRTLPPEQLVQRQLPDAFETLLVALGIGAAVAGLTKDGDRGWSSASTIGALAGGAVLFALALVRARPLTVCAEQDIYSADLMHSSMRGHAIVAATTIRRLSEHPAAHANA